MSWTKKEIQLACDNHFYQTEHKSGNAKNAFYPEMKILKSSIVGDIYYGALEISYPKSNLKPTRVIAVIAETSVDENGDLDVKSMDESVGPVYTDCPKVIIKMLTPTDSEYANKWRKICLEK